MGFHIAILLVLIAGLSTGFGGALSFVLQKGNDKFLPVSLGFAAGIMIFLALTELLAKSNEMLCNELGRTGQVISAVSFFAGIIIIGLIDRLFPHNHSEAVFDNVSKAELMRTGIVTMTAVSIHNIPESIAMMLSIQYDQASALPLLIAVIMHNIPVGVAIALPIYYATSSKAKALACSSICGLTMPVSAIAGYLILAPYLSDTVFGCLYALAAGLMVFISVDDLPTAFRHGKRHSVTYGFIFGMVVMVFSVFIFDPV